MPAIKSIFEGLLAETRALGWQFLILWLPKHPVVGGCDNISFGDGEDGRKRGEVVMKARKWRWQWPRQSSGNCRSMAVWGAASCPPTLAQMELLFGCQLDGGPCLHQVRYRTWIWSWNLRVSIVIVGVLKINWWQKVALLSCGFCCICFWNSQFFAQQKSSSLLNFLFVLLEPSPTTCQCPTCYSDYSGESGPRTVDKARLPGVKAELLSLISSVVQGIKSVCNTWIFFFFVASLFQCRKDLTVQNCRHNHILEAEGVQGFSAVSLIFVLLSKR